MIFLFCGMYVHLSGNIFCPTLCIDFKLPANLSNKSWGLMGFNDVTGSRHIDTFNGVFVLQGPPQPGQPFKFSVGESCDRIKEEFNFLQAQYHRYPSFRTYKLVLVDCRQSKMYELCLFGTNRHSQFALSIVSENLWSLILIASL